MVAIAVAAAHRVFDQLLDADAFSAWAPDSRTVALTTHVGTRRQLSLIHVDGGPPTAIDLGGVIPVDVLYRPPDGRQLLIRGWDSTGAVDLYLYDLATGLLRPLGLPGHPSVRQRSTTIQARRGVSTANGSLTTPPRSGMPQLGSSGSVVVDVDGGNERAAGADGSSRSGGAGQRSRPGWSFDPRPSLDLEPGR